MTEYIESAAAVASSERRIFYPNSQMDEGMSGTDVRRSRDQHAAKRRIFSGINLIAFNYGTCQQQQLPFSLLQYQSII